jgi:hypothetical protein
MTGTKGMIVAPLKRCLNHGSGFLQVRSVAAPYCGELTSSTIVLPPNHDMKWCICNTGSPVERKLSLGRGICKRQEVLPIRIR